MQKHVKGSLGLLVVLTAITTHAGATGAGTAVPIADAAGAVQLAAVSPEDQAVDPADQDTVTFLGQLGLIRGHLWVGLQLYSKGHHEMARTHMKHPEDELYADLLPALEARNSAGFAAELTALSSAVESDQPVAAVEQAHNALSQAMDRVEGLADVSLKTVLLSIEYMTRTAAEEYALGVSEGHVVNHHEYQDSLGFTEAARQRLDKLAANLSQTEAEATDKVRKQLQRIDALWPELVPAGRLHGDASLLYAAADDIGAIALSLP